MFIVDGDSDTSLEWQSTLSCMGHMGVVKDLEIRTTKDIGKNVRSYDVVGE